MNSPVTKPGITRIWVPAIAWTLFVQGAATAQSAGDYYVQGKIAYNNARYAEASEFFTEAIRLDSTEVNYYLQRGFCKSLLKNFESAIEDFTMAIALKPDHQWAYVSRGSARNKLRQYEAAIGDFDKALSLDPDDAESYNNRGFAKKALGDMEGACADWIRSRKLGNAEAKIILKNNRCK